MTATRSHSLHADTNHTRTGFTLLELVLVLLLISIGVGIVAPILGNFARGRRMEDTAAQIVVLCNHARMQAISEGRPFRLDFDPNGKSYGLTAQQGGQFVSLGTDFGQRFPVADDVRVETDLPRSQDGIFVTFKANGRTEPAPVNVKVSDTKGESVLIICESPTELFHIVATH